MSFVVDNELTCCDTPLPKNYKIKVQRQGTTGCRKRPSAKAQKTLLEKYEQGCAYCHLKFGDVVVRDKAPLRPIVLKLAWDHRIPYAYSGDSSDENFVPSCHVCNGLKSSKIFDTLEECGEYLRTLRRQKGIRIYGEAKN